MSRLEEGRKVIDRVDAELVRLFQERFEAVLKIAEYKRDHDMPVFDAGREAAIIAKHSADVPEELRPYFEAWYGEMLKQSKEFQKKFLNLNEAGSENEND